MDFPHYINLGVMVIVLMLLCESSPR